LGHKKRTKKNLRGCANTDGWWTTKVVTSFQNRREEKKQKQGGGRGGGLGKVILGPASEGEGKKKKLYDPRENSGKLGSSLEVKNFNKLYIRTTGGT